MSYSSRAWYEVPDDDDEDQISSNGNYHLNTNVQSQNQGQQAVSPNVASLLGLPSQNSQQNASEFKPQQPDIFQSSLLNSQVTGFGSLGGSGLSGWSRITDDLAKASHAAIEQKQLKEQQKKAQLAAARAAKLAAAAAEAAAAKEAQARAEALAQSEAEQARAAAAAAFLTESKKLTDASDGLIKVSSGLSDDEKEGTYQDENSRLSLLTGNSNLVIDDHGEIETLSPSHATPIDFSSFTSSILDKRKHSSTLRTKVVGMGSYDALEAKSNPAWTYISQLTKKITSFLPKPRSTSLADRWGQVDSSSTIWDDIRPLIMPVTLLIANVVVVFLVLRVVLFYYADQDVFQKLMAATQSQVASTFSSDGRGQNPRRGAGIAPGLVYGADSATSGMRVFKPAARLAALRAVEVAEICPYPLKRMLTVCAGHSLLVVVALLVFLHDIRARPRSYQTASLLKRINRRWLIIFFWLVPVVNLILAVWVESWLGGLGIGKHEGMLQCYLTAPVSFSTARLIGLFEALVPTCIVVWCLMKLDRDGTLYDVRTSDDPDDIDWDLEDDNYDEGDDYAEKPDLESGFGRSVEFKSRSRLRTSSRFVPREEVNEEATALLGERNDLRNSNQNSSMFSTAISNTYVLESSHQKKELTSSSALISSSISNISRIADSLGGTSIVSTSTQGSAVIPPAPQLPLSSTPTSLLSVSPSSNAPSSPLGTPSTNNSNVSPMR